MSDQATDLFPFHPSKAFAEHPKEITAENLDFVYAAALKCLEHHSSCYDGLSDKRDKLIRIGILISAASVGISVKAFGDSSWFQVWTVGGTSIIFLILTISLAMTDLFSRSLPTLGNNPSVLCRPGTLRQGYNGLVMNELMTMDKQIKEIATLNEERGHVIDRAVNAMCLAPIASAILALIYLAVSTLIS